MTNEERYRARFALQYEKESHRRWVAGREVIIHCHHYNSRLQRTIENARQIDGRGIIVSSAEAVFADQLAGLFERGESETGRWDLAEALYSHLGFGRLDFSRVADGIVTAKTSHFVEGWNAGFKGRTEPVCSFACGYAQAAVRSVTGRSVIVTEEECMISGAPQCRFSVRNDPMSERPAFLKKTVPATIECRHEALASNIDEDRIVTALVEMPIYGDEEGLIPSFGVYLANMPADFYNLISIRFVEAMTDKGLGETAERLLYFDAETCGMNTFRGIVNSPEWEGLVIPMIKEPRDTIFGIVAVSNGLGWGDWRITAYEPARSLTLVCSNGYESTGYRQWRGGGSSPKCHMLSGVAAGVMELVSLKGPLEERFGTFISRESSCLCHSDEECRFEVRRA